MSRLGERGEVVNTSGCEPDIREFDSHRSPHFPNLTLICRINKLVFFS